MHTSFALILGFSAALAGSALHERDVATRSIPAGNATSVPVVRAPSPVPATPAPSPVRTPRTGFRGEVIAGPVEADVIDVIDGDTIEVRANVWLGQSIVTRVRLRGIDAAELSSTCGDERDLALASRDALIGYLGPGRVHLTEISRDKYGGRVVARVLTSAGEDVGTAMLTAGFAIVYDGGRREPWCGVQLTAGR